MVEYFQKKGFNVGELPKSRSIHGDFPLRIRAISYPLGAIKFYPASLKYIGEHKKEFENLFKQGPEEDKNGGSIELTIDNVIHYHWPLENRS